MNSINLIFLGLLVFAIFSNVHCQDSSEEEQNENTTQRLLGLLGPFPGFAGSGIDPSLLLFSQLFSGGNLSLPCLLALTPLFGQNNLFPILNLNSFFSQTNPFSAFPFGIPSQANLITFAQLAPFFQNSRTGRQLPRVLGLCNDSGDSNSAVLLFLFYLLSANSGNFNPFPTAPPQRTCTNYRGVPTPFVDRKLHILSLLPCYNDNQIDVTIIGCNYFSKSYIITEQLLKL